MLYEQSLGSFHDSVGLRVNPIVGAYPSGCLKLRGFNMTTSSITMQALVSVHAQLRHGLCLLDHPRVLLWWEFLNTHRLSAIANKTS